jgi:hypothetical membrane protein
MMKKLTLSGSLFFIGGVLWCLGILAAESWYPGYSSRIDYVSDLGIGPTAIIFNGADILLGACMVLGAVFLYNHLQKKPLPILLTVSGIGAMGVGVFTIDFQPAHSVFTLLAILFGALAAMVSYLYAERPVSIFGFVLGALTSVLLVVFFPYLGLPIGSTVTFLGMAKGSLERWVIYPILFWIIGFGGYQMGSAKSEKQESEGGKKPTFGN